MITIFSTPRPFRPPFDTIQCNAVKSWLSLGESVEVMLLGSDDGTAEFAAEHGLRHLPNIACNPFGAPQVDSLFTAAEAVARYNLMCFVNADIILTDDFIPTVRGIVEQKERFIIVGRRRNLDLNIAWDFRRQSSFKELVDLARSKGSIAGPGYLDYFVFQKGFWGELPPFAVGAGRLDNWLVHRAASLHAAVVDVSREITAIHQNHDPPGIMDEKYGARSSLPGLAGNSRLSEDNWDRLWIGFGTADECTHILRGGRVRRKWGLRPALQFLANGRNTRPLVSPLIRLLYTKQPAP